MRACAICVTVAVFGCLAIAQTIGVAAEAGTNRYVSLTVSLQAQTLRRGQTGLLRIAFDPEDDIHINAEPAVRVSIGRSRFISLSGAAEQEVNGSDGYLSTRSPVTQRFVVTKHARPGRYALQGSVVYYYCSDSEGWCRKHVEPVELTITIAP